MKKPILNKMLFFGLLLIHTSFSIQGQSSMTYLFDGTLNEEGTGPALTPQIAGIFGSNTGCTGTPQFYSFPINTGLTFDNATAGNFLGSSYTIELLFELDITSGYRKIIDWKNLSDDCGFYINNVTNFYCLASGGPTLVNNMFHHVVLRREIDNTITVWLDGTLTFSQIDVSEHGVMDANNLLIFFADDLATGQNETSPGSVHLIRLYDTPLTNTAVNSLFSQSVCEVANAENNSVPTLSQWGLIILTLLLLSFGTVAIRSRQMVLASSYTSSSFTLRQVPFDKVLFIKILLPLSVLVFSIFRIAIGMFGYELTTSDIPGSLIAVPLLAYLLHLLGDESIEK